MILCGFHGSVCSYKNDCRLKNSRELRITEKDPETVRALLDLVDKESYGNPENPLRWTCKNTRVLAKKLADQGHPIIHNAVYDLLTTQGFTLQTNRKLMQSGKQHPDRNEQFSHINDTVLKYINRNLPVISVDCKKKENIGEYYNGGTEFSEKSNPVKVLDHVNMIGNPFHGEWNYIIAPHGKNVAFI